MGGIKKRSVDKNRSLETRQKFKMTQAKSYRCERDLITAESKILKLAQVKFHYAAGQNFILDRRLASNKNGADKILVGKRR